MNTISRRFIREHSLAAVSAPQSSTQFRSLTNCVWGYQMRGRGKQLMRIFNQFNDVEIAMISDVLEPRMNSAMDEPEQMGLEKLPQQVVFHERILERKDIDAVVMPPPSIGMEFRSSRRVRLETYLHQPLSHTIVEGKNGSGGSDGVIAVMVHGSVRESIIRMRKSNSEWSAGKNCAGGCWNYHNTGNRVGRARSGTTPGIPLGPLAGSCSEGSHNLPEFQANLVLPMGDDDQLGGASD